MRKIQIGLVTICTSVGIVGCLLGAPAKRTEKVSMSSFDYPGPPPPPKNTAFHPKLPIELVTKITELTEVTDSRIVPFPPYVVQSTFKSNVLTIKVLFSSATTEGLSAAAALLDRAQWTFSAPMSGFAPGPSDLGEWSMVGYDHVFWARANLGLIVRDKTDPPNTEFESGTHPRRPPGGHCPPGSGRHRGGTPGDIENRRRSTASYRR